MMLPITLFFCIALSTRATCCYLVLCPLIKLSSVVVVSLVGVVVSCLLFLTDDDCSWIEFVGSLVN